MSQELPKVVHVVGMGRMGQGIALSFAYAGIDVILIDVKPRESAEYAALCAAARQAIEMQLQMQVAFGRITPAQADVTLARVRCCGCEEAEAALAHAILLFEAVPEILDVKRDLFNWIGGVVPSDALIASTTSTFLVTYLQEFIVQPERFMNAHWLNPALLMPLVEVSSSSVTDKMSVEAMLAVLRAIGKVPVLCGPSPGYIVPRIQALAMNEAARMVEEGVASAEAIDTAIRVGFGTRFAVLGMLEFIDWGGCDILYQASQYLARELDSRFVPASIVSEYHKNDRNGLKDMIGFYEYQKFDVENYIFKRMKEFCQILDTKNLMPVFNAAYSM